MTQPQPRILVVDDRLTNIELIADIFGEEYEVLFATEGEKALEIAATENPGVILLDVMMPGMDGYEVCRRLKANHRTEEIPVIFITALGDEEAETRGLELGAVDYVAKPFRPAVVKMRVKNQIELKLAREQLTRLAITDGLTGLANRRHFDNVLTLEYARHSRSGSELSLIMLDIDQFKAYNDTYGHIKGDDCLRQVAHAIGSAVGRPPDLAARYGGEEFVCILPETNQAGAVVVADRIRKAIIALAIPHGASNVADCVTASLGVVTTRCVQGKSVLNIVAQADEQLYAAKCGGRNRIEFDITYSGAELKKGNFVKMSWESAFSSGNHLIDQGHQRLLLISNELSEAILSARPADEISAIATRLLDVIIQHCSDEERILKRLGFPGLGHQAAEHAKLINKCVGLVQEFKAGTCSASDIFNFLSLDVIIHHMLVEDREYFPFTNTSSAADLI